MAEQTDIVDMASEADRQAQPSVAPAAREAPAGRLRVGWVAGRTTAERFGRALQPLAIGLMDELVEILALCPEGADIQELPNPPVETLSFGRTHRWGFSTFTFTFTLANTGAVAALAGELRHRKIQLLHALDAEAWPLTSQLAHLAGLNCVVSSYKLGDWKTLGRLGGSVGKVLAASELIRQALLNRRVAQEPRIELVRPGVYQVRKPTCFPDPNLCVSVVAGGPMDDYASFEAVIRSFAELRRSGRDAVFFLIGNGRAEKRLRQLAETLGVRAELTFVDRQPPRLLPEIFKAADLYVAPIPDRSIDMPCLLAMAAGVPVLVAGQGASDFLIDGQTALGFAPRSAPDLTAKLTALLDDHAKASALAERALAHLRSAHSPAGAVAAVTRIYRQVAALPTPSPALQNP